MFRPSLDYYLEKSKPWSPESRTEAVLDVVTLGLTRRQRQHRTLAHYALMDEYRLSPDPTLQHEVEPRPLPHVAPRARAIAQLALQVATTAEFIHIDTYQGYGATLFHGEDGKRRARLSLAGQMHDPTLHRIREATGRDYMRDESDTLAVLMTSGDSVDIEGVGPMANEYRDLDSKTGRTSWATFLIRGLPATLAGQFVDSLRTQPAETLDGVVYTAFADIEVPGRSMLQVSPTNQREGSLFIPGTCSEVVVATMPTK